HMLGSVLLGLQELPGSPRADGTRTLDRARPDRPAGARENALRRARDDRPPAAAIRHWIVWAQRREAGGDRARIAVERRREMLHESDLVDVAPGARPADSADGARIVGRRPRPLPRTETKPLRSVAI